MKHDVSTTPRLQELKKSRRRNLRNKLIFFGVGVLAIFIALGFLSRISALNIKNVAVTGNAVIDSEDIQKVADEAMSGHYFWLIPKTNIFFYPKNKIKENLTTEFKRMKDLSLGIGKNGILEIKLAERTGIYIWCGVDLPKEGEEEKCLFLDKDGYSFDEAPYFSGDVYFKFYGSLFETHNPIFPKLVRFKENLENIELEPVRLLAKEDGDMVMYLSAGNSNNIRPEITFKLDTDLDKAAENLQAALGTEPLRTDFKKKYSLLSYIDLRFGNKVYYRFR